MMVAFIYDLLLFIMLYVLYRSGKIIAKTGRIWSSAGLAAILIYTLNEGLRFGRGIDYNLYGMTYEQLANGSDSDWDISFQIIADSLINMDISWQGFVILMSFVFVVSTLFLLKIYKDVLPYALPLFVLFSMYNVENMVRWYMAFSFVLIGLYFLLSNDNLIKFLFFSVLACSFHLAMAPIPIALYVIYRLKTTLLHPLVSLTLFFLIAFSFQTDFMMRFVDLANMLTTVSGRFEGYGNKIDYWLTSGYAGVEQSSFPGMAELLFIIVLVYMGNKVVKVSGSYYIYAYNLFLIGLFLYPIARQVELVARYQQIFYFFRAIVLAGIIQFVFIKSKVKFHQVMLLIAIISLIGIGQGYFTRPFRTPDLFLYVWDGDNRTYSLMYDTWRDVN